MGGRDQSERLVAINWNQRSQSAGARTMDEIKEAIRLGGGSGCEVGGVLRELDRTDYVIVPRAALKGLRENLAGLIDQLPSE
jgi:hypothetical protein